MLALFVPACAALRQERDTEPYAKKRDIAIAKLAKAPGSRAAGQPGRNGRGTGRSPTARAKELVGGKSACAGGNQLILKVRRDIFQNTGDPPGPGVPPSRILQR